MQQAAYATKFNLLELMFYHITLVETIKTNPSNDAQIQKY